jgi:hypothetical protein
MDGRIFNSNGEHVAIVRGSSILTIRGQKIYNLKGNKIYRPSGELVGHLPNIYAADKRLYKAADKLFPLSERPA